MKNILRTMVVAGLLLLVPLIAMQFNNGADWDLADFVTVWVLLTGAGLTYQFATRKTDNPTHKLVIGLIVLFVLLYLWAELAVGIFTNWGS